MGPSVSMLLKNACICMHSVQRVKYLVTVHTCSCAAIALYTCHNSERLYRLTLCVRMNKKLVESDAELLVRSLHVSGSSKSR